MFNSAARRLPARLAAFRGHQVQPVWSRLAATAAVAPSPQQCNNGFGRRWKSTQESPTSGGKESPSRPQDPDDSDDPDDPYDIDPETKKRAMASAHFASGLFFTVFLGGFVAAGWFGHKYWDKHANASAERPKYRIEIHEVPTARHPAATAHVIRKVLEDALNSPLDSVTTVPASDQAAAAAAEPRLTGPGFVLELQVDETWTPENFGSKILETAGFPLEQGEGEGEAEGEEDRSVGNPRARAVRLLQRVGRAAGGSALLLLRNAAEHPKVAAAIHSAFEEAAPRLTPDGGGVFVVEVQ